MYRIALSFLLIPLLAGCVSKQDLGGLATVSALVLAVPLVPVAEAYHVINDTEGKAAEQQLQWRASFDPVYQQRIAIIDNRDPRADAERKFAANTLGFFPIERDSKFLIGMNWGKNEVDGVANQQIIDSDEELTTLQQLFADDPTHQKVAGHRYNSPIYDCFVAKAFTYRKVYNQRLSELSGLYSVSLSDQQRENPCQTP
ncbi:MAG: Uncharacterised protein [Pseudidiomarina mangrovi]|nr:MAG: Uncharacterised protein [Pseudidiomarina mangrovi]